MPAVQEGTGMAVLAQERRKQAQKVETLGSELKLASGVSSPSDPHPSPLVHYWVMVKGEKALFSYIYSFNATEIITMRLC